MNIKDNYVFQIIVGLVGIVWIITMTTFQSHAKELREYVKLMNNNIIETRLNSQRIEGLEDKHKG